MPSLTGSLLVAVTVTLALVFLVFLVLKVDNLWDLNYGHVTGPLLVYFGLTAAVFFYRGLTLYSRDGRSGIFFYRLGVAVLAVGSFVTIYLLTKKFEFEISLSFTGTMLPFMVALLITGALFITSLNSRS